MRPILRPTSPYSPPNSVLKGRLQSLHAARLKADSAKSQGEGARA
eukprot:CAMPEP_0203986890 /NCGR_PEP_ID=MMETSP0360-20130528/6364_1 /ASSEMBLY_ACC=CAM_ASM_000342 /TAXON_ID=268821 /ORGANISM="Scrippsiella Hangoei, Strain SHTV-5" /LENGTH=44 /DNA_ID= /DNA_START= /DNA_END= /DNA_ORIENTATION=